MLHDTVGPTDGKGLPSPEHRSVLTPVRTNAGGPPNIGRREPTLQGPEPRWADVPFPHRRVVGIVSMERRPDAGRLPGLRLRAPA